MADIRGGAGILRQNQIGFMRAYSAAIRPITDRVTAILVNAADADGLIPFAQRNPIRQAVSRAVIAFFATTDGRPYGADGIEPLGMYPQILNTALANSQFETIMLQSRYIERAMPAQALAYLQDSRQRGPGAEGLQVAEELLRHYRGIFFQTYDLRYDPAHRFVDPRGYILSDRIWRSGRRARQVIDEILVRSIADGVGAVETARRLTRSLRPSRANIRTSGERIIETAREQRIQRLYWGRRASFDAMRLARTEITAAIGRSQLAGGRANPFVDRMRWTLSPNHPRADTCDGFEGLHGIDDVPLYPAHAQCLCYLTPVNSRPTRAVVDDIIESRRRLLEGDRRFQPLLNTASGVGFARHLLGPLMQFVSAELLAA